MILWSGPNKDSSCKGEAVEEDTGCGIKSGPSLQVPSYSEASIEMSHNKHGQSYKLPRERAASGYKLPWLQIHLSISHNFTFEFLGLATVSQKTRQLEHLYEAAAILVDASADWHSW